MLFENYSPVPSQRRLIARRFNLDRPSPATRSSSSSAYYTAPPALPCPNFYQLHPEKVGATANVVLTDAQELQPWLLIARRVTREEAKKRGGCIQFNSSYGKVNGEINADAMSVRSLYYCISDSDDVVYGRAAYLPRSRGAETATMSRKHFSETFHSDGCTEDSSDEGATLCAAMADSMCSDSCSCACGEMNEPVQTA